MQVKFHHIVRAVILDKEKLLIAHFKGHHSFLPGGHVEMGEGAQKALLRELKEELGVTCHIESFIGVVENQWKSQGILHHEINHLFRVNSEQLSSESNPKSKEPHLDFYWINPSNENLERYKVLPDLLQKVLPEIIKKEQGATWFSSISES